ncbi:MAG: hypothetical protein ACE5EQ_09750 [Phycisphaerae bacterium]
MPRHRSLVVLPIGVLLALGPAVAGCLNVKAPDTINVGSRRGRDSIDTSRVPPTASHEAARRKLAEAYDRIQYLERKVRDLQKDKRELKKEREEYKKKYKREKKRHDD